MPYRRKNPQKGHLKNHIFKGGQDYATNEQKEAARNEHVHQQQGED